MEEEFEECDPLAFGTMSPPGTSMGGGMTTTMPMTTSTTMMTTTTTMPNVEFKLHYSTTQPWFRCKECDVYVSSKGRMLSHLWLRHGKKWDVFVQSRRQPGADGTPSSGQPGGAKKVVVEGIDVLTRELMEREAEERQKMEWSHFVEMVEIWKFPRVFLTRMEADDERISTMPILTPATLTPIVPYTFKDEGEDDVEGMLALPPPGCVEKPPPPPRVVKKMGKRGRPKGSTNKVLSRLSRLTAVRLSNKKVNRSCPLRCGKTFSSFFNLKRHLRGSCRARTNDAGAYHDSDDEDYMPKKKFYVPKKKLKMPLLKKQDEPEPEPAPVPSPVFHPRKHQPVEVKVKVESGTVVRLSDKDKPMVDCPQHCGVKFSTLSNLRRHLKQSCAKGKLTEAEVEQWRSFSPAGPARHNKQLVDIQMRCAVCGEEFAERRALLWHRWMERHDPDFEALCSFACEFEGCGVKMGTVKSLLLHQCLHSPQWAGMKKWEQFDFKIKKLLEVGCPLPQCPVCEKHVLFRSQLPKHMERQHDAHKQFICDICGASYRAMDRLREHIRRQGCKLKLLEKETRTFPCGLCPVMLKSQKGVLNHKRVVHGIKIIKKQAFREPCPDCGYIPHGAHAYIKHVLSHEKVKQYECPGCHLKYSNRGNLLAHMRDRCKPCKESGLVPEKRYPSKGPTLPCPYCCEILERQYDLREHLKMHGSDGIACGECNGEFSELRYLHTHYKKAHGRDDWGLQCHLCGKVITKDHNIAVHYLGKHEGVDPPSLKELYDLQSCIPIPINDELSISVVEEPSSKPTPTGNITCDVCGSCKFVTLRGLQTHMIVMHGIQPKAPFVGTKDKNICNSCEFVASSQQELTDHRRQLHKLLPYYECDVCGKKFSKNQRRLFHMRDHHGLREYTIPVIENNQTQEDLLLPSQASSPDSYVEMEEEEGVYMEEVAEEEEDSEMSFTVELIEEGEEEDDTFMEEDDDEEENGYAMKEELVLIAEEGDDNAEAAVNMGQEQELDRLEYDPSIWPSF